MYSHGVPKGGPCANKSEANTHTHTITHTHTHFVCGLAFYGGPWLADTFGTTRVHTVGCSCLRCASTCGLLRPPTHITSVASRRVAPSFPCRRLSRLLLHAETQVCTPDWDTGLTAAADSAKNNTRGK